MTRIRIQRGSAGSSSSNPIRPSVPISSSSSSQPQTPSVPLVSVANSMESIGEVREQVAEVGRLGFCGGVDTRTSENELLPETWLADKTGCPSDEIVDIEKVCNDDFVSPGDLVKGLDERITSDKPTVENEAPSYPAQMVAESSYPPPPPPVPPPKASLLISTTSRFSSGGSNTMWNMSPRRTKAWPVVSTRTTPSNSRPSSPRSHGDSEGYNSADEQNPCFGSSYNDAEERQFEIDIRRAKGLEVKRMLEDGNCLFRAIADQVYGDSEAYDLTRQLCMDYMEKERDHFSQFVTEGFKSYCIRKRRDKVYGNNVEIQALSEMFNRPIHIYSYSTEPINIFHRSYNTDMPPIRLSYHHGYHYNSLVDPRRLTVGAGLGFSSLQGRDINKDEVKAAIKAQQEQQIDNALLAEGRFYSDMELTEKEIELMVMEASRAEYIGGCCNNQAIEMGSSTSGAAEPSSSSGASRGGEGSSNGRGGMQVLMSMGFSYLQAKEAFDIFGDDVHSMLCYILETDVNSNTRRKGKEATTK